MAAFDLTDNNPFATTTFGSLNTDRPGFTFNPDLDLKADFSALGKGLELDPSLLAGLSMPSIRSSSGAGYRGASLGGNDTVDQISNMLMALKDKSGKNLAMGYAMKTAAKAGDLFSALMTYSTTRASAEAKEANVKQDVKNQMLALDNQITYYKNQITDKFAQLMARNTVAMASKNLRVSAGALLEQTKDAAYDATKDISMLESNKRLKEIALKSEEKQAHLVSKLEKSQATASVLKGLADLGLMVGTGYTALEPMAKEAGGWGNLFSNMFGSDSDSLNDTVYGG